MTNWIFQWSRALLAGDSPPLKACLVGFHSREYLNGLTKLTFLLIVEIRDQLKGTIFSGVDETTGGDGMAASDKDTWERFFNRLEQAINGEIKFSITLQDPMANSYVQDLCSPAIDPQITTEDYTRTEEEEEDLGFKDMKTEGYENDVEKTADAKKE